MAEMINCPSCGTRHAWDVRFCSNCGTSLTPAIGSTTRLAERTCPTCRSPMPEHAQFCTECGQQVGDESASHKQPYPQTHAKDRSRERAMMCPGCRDVALQMTERQGIEVDYCPSCRGVWLDRGELDKIIERVAQPQNTSTPYPNQRYDRGAPGYPQQRHDDDHDRYRKKKRGGFLDELFDFD